MIQDALAATASSRNISSLGSRQALIKKLTDTSNPFFLNSLIAFNRLLNERYLSNLGLIKLTENSAIV